MTESLPSSSVSTSSSERRQVTVLFADMAGFTSISERLGEEGTYTLIQPIYELMATAVKEQGGSVREFTGDGIMALFGVPNALEDAPLRACRAALLIQERMSVAAPSIEARHGARAQMRIGINTGLAVVTQIRGEGEGENMTALGDTVNLASRLQTLAEPGKVLLSEATYRQVQGLVDATYAGEHEIKGKVEKQKAYRLDAVRQGAVRFDAAISRGLSAYVGRADELESLERELVSAPSGLRVVDVLAEPGMGKSRLLHEFRRKIGRDRAFILQGNCSPDGKQTPFLPFIEIVRGSFRIRAGDAEKDVAEKLETGLSALGLSTPQNLGLLLNLLGLKPPEGSLSGLDGVLIGLRTRDLFQSLLAARCAMSAVVMIVEDLHWIDSVSEEVLGNIVGAGASLPLLVLVTRRPEYVPSWLDRPEVTRLTLSPLLEDAVGQLVSSRLGVTQLPPELVKLISDRAEGNALFAEEIISFLADRGVLRTRVGMLEYDAAAVAAAMPSSVQSLLTSRVDQLVPGDRTLLQAASVIGRRFTPDLLAALVPNSGDMQTRLDALSSLDLVYPDGRSGNYAFKHALIRDALYQRLLTGPRTALHLKIAEEIERRSANRLTEVAEVLAHHYSQTDHNGKAFTYLAMAGTKALGIYSLEEAEKCFGVAYGLLEKNPQSATDLQVADFLAGYVAVLGFSVQWKKIIQIVRSQRARLNSLGDAEASVVVRHHYTMTLIWVGDYASARGEQAELSAMASRIQTPRALAYALASEVHFSSAMAPMPLDAFEARAEQAVAAALESEDAHIHSMVRFAIAWDEFHRGRTLKAHAAAEALIREGDRTNDPRAIGLGLALQLWIALTNDDYDQALSFAERAVQNAITPFDRNAAHQGHIESLVMLKRPEGLPLLQAFVSECNNNGWHWYMCSAESVLGLALILNGEIAKGIKQVKTAIKHHENDGYKTCADWHRLLLAEVYVEVLSGREKPALKILLRNLMSIIRVFVSGEREIVRLLDNVRRNPHFDPNGRHIGRAEMLQGLMYQARKKEALAVKHLSEARRITAQFGQTRALARIDSALGQLGA